MLYDYSYVYVYIVKLQCWSVYAVEMYFRCLKFILLMHFYENINSSKQIVIKQNEEIFLLFNSIFKNRILSCEVMRSFQSFQLLSTF